MISVCLPRLHAAAHAPREPSNSLNLIRKSHQREPPLICSNVHNMRSRLSNTVVFLNWDRHTPGGRGGATASGWRASRRDGHRGVRDENSLRELDERLVRPADQRQRVRPPLPPIAPRPTPPPRRTLSQHGDVPLTRDARCMAWHATFLSACPMFVPSLSW
jgi:hypothetical protein